jgi:hypothetical protein
VGGHGRPQWQRVLRPDPSLSRRRRRGSSSKRPVFRRAEPATMTCCRQATFARRNAAGVHPVRGPVPFRHARSSVGCRRGGAGRARRHRSRRLRRIGTVGLAGTALPAGSEHRRDLLALTGDLRRPGLAGPDAGMVAGKTAANSPASWVAMMGSPVIRSLTQPARQPAATPRRGSSTCASGDVASSRCRAAAGIDALLLRVTSTSLAAAGETTPVRARLALFTQQAPGPHRAPVVVHRLPASGPSGSLAGPAGPTRPANALRPVDGASWPPRNRCRSGRLPSPGNGQPRRWSAATMRRRRGVCRVVGRSDGDWLIGRRGYSHFHHGGRSSPRRRMRL